jgi:Tfp pilus assembly protein PilZ
MQPQRRERIAKRMPCAVRVGESLYSGLVLNLSPGGLFIQTNADAGQGSAVGLELQAPGESDGIPLAGTVAWRKLVPSQLRQVAGGGFGIRIDRADERYYSVLSRWMRTEVSGAAGPAWRVRVRASASPRSRTVTVEAETADEAREKALAHVGADWHVLEIFPL